MVWSKLGATMSLRPSPLTSPTTGVAKKPLGRQFGWLPGQYRSAPWRKVRTAPPVWPFSRTTRPSMVATTTSTRPSLSTSTTTGEAWMTVAPRLACQSRAPVSTRVAVTVPLGAATTSSGWSSPGWVRSARAGDETCSLVPGLVAMLLSRTSTERRSRGAAVAAPAGAPVGASPRGATRVATPRASPRTTATTERGSADALRVGTGREGTRTSAGWLPVSSRG